MIMKRFITLMLLLLATNCVFAQSNVDEHQWKATLKVVDEAGSPVAGAGVKVGYYTNNTSVDITGTTDANGIFVASHTTSTFNYIEYGLAFVVEKDGYYETRLNCELGIPYDSTKWNPTVSLLLKRVGKPIAMYAKKYVMGLNLPEYNKQIGYDFMIGDLVGPYGKGINSDIFFTENHADEKSGYTFTIGFPKEGDGIQEFILPDREMGSGLRSPHEAPVDGYQPKHEQTQMPNPNRIYLFRVRTAKDHAGNIVSAHYGKIYGDFMQFTYYLNPTPNDRNIEFDPKQNLLGGLQSFEGVNAP